MKTKMKKYRVTSFMSILGSSRHVVQMRYWLFFWVHVKDFSNDKEANDYCEQLNSKSIVIMDK